MQAFQVSLEAGTDYQVDPAANEVTVTVADTAESLPQLSLSVEPTTLVESEGTVLVQTFNLSTAPPPEGIEVSMIATGLEEFDLTNIETTGIAGEIAVAESEPPRLIFMMTEATATISLPVADDGISEEVETIIFTLEPNESYQVSPAAGTGSFQIVDVPADIPTPPAEVEVNDSLETAIAINLSAGNPVTIFGEADYFYDFSETSPILDFSEDVDLYSFELLAGESIAVDVDAIALDGSESLLQPVLRIFDANGGELDSVGQVDTLEEITPGEGEATLTFTAETAGTYYAGISVLGNDDYDPTVIGSGSGWTLDGVAEPDAYQVTFSTPSSGPGEMLVGTDGADTLTGTDGDEVLDGLAGDDTYTGGTGADQFVLAIAQGVDTITDFEVGVDQISLGGLTPEGVRFFEMGSETFLLTNSNELLGVVQGVTGLDSSVFA
ncbi:MAG: pre-peptidase C-terminal domain-containing protein [Cyanobacteria bacterium P01_C01_bin.70]